VDKDKLLAALHAIQSGEKEAGHFHDELETIITLIVNAKDEDITAAWEDFRTDTE
jgi:Asp-tRNA(Asn)/Glu-tRNA(Gln) amidotransferase C subunit